MSARKNTPPETVIDIFLAAGQQKEIARRYGLSQGTVSKIKRRHRYEAQTAMWCPEAVNGLLIAAAFTGEVQ